MWALVRGRILLTAHGGGRIRSRCRSYLAKLDAGESPIDEFRILTALKKQVEEFFFLGLRQVEGVNLERARERWGASFLKRWEDKIQNLSAGGLGGYPRGDRFAWLPMRYLSISKFEIIPGIRFPKGEGFNLTFYPSPKGRGGTARR
jgi:hypothetical protein